MAAPADPAGAGTPPDWYHELRCPICLNLPLAAVESRCCHQIFCDTCADALPAPAVCPVCRSGGRKLAHAPAHLARRLLASAQVCCPRGCGTEMPMERLKAHEKSCPKATRKCPGCAWEGLRSAFVAHLAEAHTEILIEKADQLFECSHGDGGSGAARSGTVEYFVTHRETPRVESIVAVGAPVVSSGFSTQLLAMWEGPEAWAAFSFCAVPATSAAPAGMKRVQCGATSFFAWTAPALGRREVFIFRADDRLHITAAVPADLDRTKDWCGWHFASSFFAQLGAYNAAARE